MGAYQTVSLDMTQYTTNQNFFGHIANALSYVINFYKVLPFTAAGARGFKTFSNSTILNCVTKTCTFYKFVYSGNTNIAAQNFDDVTAPLLFFLSISQAIFYVVYLLFLRNY